MTDKNVVKQLEELLEPIKKDLGEINKKLEQHTKILGQHTKILDQHTKILGQHTRKLDQHTGALVNIEDTIKVYGDMYQVNNDNAIKLEKRIGTLESNEGIVPPQEFRLIDL